MADSKNSFRTLDNVIYNLIFVDFCTRKQIGTVCSIDKVIEAERVG